MVILIEKHVPKIAIMNGVVVQLLIIVGFVYLDQQKNQNVFQIVMVIGAEQRKLITAETVLVV